MKKIVLLATILYFLLAPFTYHPDTKLTLRYPAIENNHIWDIYGYLNSHKLDIPDFHYPPAHYWWLKIHYPISKIVGGNGLDEWLKSGSAQASFDNNIFRYCLAVKLPLLILGLATGFLIYKIIKKYGYDENKARLGALIWYFNPITIYSLVMMGQNDVVAIFMFLLGMYFYDKSPIAIGFWALAAGVKNYPLIWAVVFLLIFEKKILKLVTKLGILVAGYGLILLPWIGKDYFREAVLNSGLSQRMFIASIPIGFEKYILLVPLLLVIIALKAWHKRTKNKLLVASLIIVECCLVIFGFSHFNPQWMLWLMPFVSIYWAIKGIKSSDLILALLVFVLWFGLTLGFDDKFLTWGLITPISPDLINFPSLVEFLKNKGIDFSNVINYFQTALAGVSIWLICRKNPKEVLLKEKNINLKWWAILFWIGLFLFLGVILNIKVNKKINSENIGTRVYLNEINNKKWSYQVDEGLKYLEVSLDNPGLNSQDEALLSLSDDRGNKIEKKISGFNAQKDSWLRIDVPENMNGRSVLKLEVNNVLTKDGLLMSRIDKEERLATNFYYHQKASLPEFLSKLLSFWWWWLLCLFLSVLYVHEKN